MQFLGRLLGWLRGGAAASGSYLLRVLLLLPVLVSGGLQLALGAALVGAFAYFSRFALDRAWLQWLQRAWYHLQEEAAAAILRKRRWLRL